MKCARFIHTFGIVMTEKERRVSDRSLENLKLGAQARYQGKVRQNFTILPETLEWLKCSGNASRMIDDLVDAAKNGELKSSNTHQRKGELKAESENVYKRNLEVEVKRLQEQLAQTEVALAEEIAQKSSWIDSAVQWQAVAERVQEPPCPTEDGEKNKMLQSYKADPQAIALLKEALTLKANAGGAIKRKIEKALTLLSSAKAR